MKYYCIKQRDITDCGAACLATVCKQYGKSISVAKLREIAGTDRDGTNAYGLVRSAERLNFTAKAVKGNAEAFFSEFPLPAIAHTVTETGLEHYVVIHKISKNKVIVADPAKGIIKTTPDEFFKIWTGALILLVPETVFDKSSETKSLFERFWRLLLPQKRLIFDVMLASVVITVLGIAGAFYFQIIIDDVLAAGLEKTLHIVSVGVILLNLFAVLLSAMRTQLLLYLSQKLDIALLLGYYDHVLKLPMNFFGTRKVGEIISRFQDASSIRDALSNVTLTVLLDTVMAIAGGIMLCVKSVKLFLIAAIMVFIYALLVFAFNKPYRRANQRQMEDNAQLTAYLVESLNGMQTIKALNGENCVHTETEFKFVKLLKSIFSLSSMENVQTALTAFVEAVGEVLILWVGAYSVMQGSMTIGSLITFNALLVYFLDPIKSLINLQPELQTAIVASDRLGEILDLEIEKVNQENKVSPTSLKGDIVIDNVTFRYGTRRAILEDFSLTIHRGARVAIVGESGAGKSTVAKLLLGLYKCEKGIITIADYAIEDISLDTLRKKIAYVPQETFLFSDTILNNLVFGSEASDIETVMECAKAAQVHTFVNELPMRYETKLDENAGNLSGGQKQRIAIARALLKKPEIMIFDEATGNLDAVTEKAVQETIERYSRDMTTIIIAHRLSTIRSCDKIFVMENGRIVESGTHQELMQMVDGRYRKLYMSQTGE